MEFNRDRDANRIRHRRQAEMSDLEKDTEYVAVPCFDLATDGERCLRFMRERFAATGESLIIKTLRYASVEVYPFGDAIHFGLTLRIRREDWESIGWIL